MQRKRIVSRNCERLDVELQESAKGASVGLGSQEHGDVGWHPADGEAPPSVQK